MFLINFGEIFLEYSAPIAAIIMSSGIFKDDLKKYDLPAEIKLGITEVRRRKEKNIINLYFLDMIR